MTEDQAYKITVLLERIATAVDQMASDIKQLKSDVTFDVKRRTAEANTRSSYEQPRR